MSGLSCSCAFFIASARRMPLAVDRRRLGALRLAARRRPRDPCVLCILALLPRLRAAEVRRREVRRDVRFLPPARERASARRVFRAILFSSY
jgi:hypothetical protein